jgi:hypothetical protein
MDWAPALAPSFIALRLVCTTSLLRFLKSALEKVAKAAFSSVF